MYGSDCDFKFHKDIIIVITLASARHINILMLELLIFMITTEKRQF